MQLYRTGEDKEEGNEGGRKEERREKKKDKTRRGELKEVNHKGMCKGGTRACNNDYMVPLGAYYSGYGVLGSPPPLSTICKWL